jgi:hypothetical protein
MVALQQVTQLHTTKRFRGKGFSTFDPSRPASRAWVRLVKQTSSKIDTMLRQPQPSWGCGFGLPFCFWVLQERLSCVCQALSVADCVLHPGVFCSLVPGMALATMFVTLPFRYNRQCRRRQCIQPVHQPSC